jgi:microcystin-dependent protein
MSDYNKTEWVNGTAPAINSTNLNKMEVGISDAHIEIQELVDGDTKAGHAVIADGLSSGTIVPGTAPVGSVALMASANVPLGFLECDGSAVSRSTYLALFNEIGVIYGIGDNVTTFNLPDLRGNFVRGWDNSRGQDPTVDRAIGTFQDEAVGPHTHPLWNGTGSGGSQEASSSGGWESRTERVGAMLPNTGVETRPKNIAMMYVIKV